MKIAKHKSDQSAYRVFELPKSLDQLVGDSQNYSPKNQVELLADSLANSPHSSSNKINTTTSLPDEWKNINFQSLRILVFLRLNYVNYLRVT